MAYGLIYELLSASKKGNTDKVRILEREYTGSDIDRNVPINPFRLIKDRSTVIKGTSLEFSMREEVDFEFKPMFSQPLKHYMVQAYRSTMLLWTGYLNTQQYEADYKPAPVNIAFMAYDGLALLKDEPFELTGREDEFTIIRYCIDKIGLNIGYAIAVNIHEENHNVSLSPFEQTYKDCEIFEDMDCYEVLERVIGRYDASITQVLGRWEIISSVDKKSTRLLYNYDGTYDTTEIAPEVLDLGYPADTGIEVYPVGVLTNNLQFGGRKVKLTHNYGLRESLLPNYDFKKYASAMFTDWTKTGTFDVYQYFKENYYFAFLNGHTTVGNDLIGSSIAITNVAGEDFVFEIDICPLGHTIAGRTGHKSPVSMEVKLLVICTVGGTTYYLSTTEGWTTTPTYIIQTITSSLTLSSIEWTKIKVITNEIPDDGVLSVALMRYYNAAPGSTYYTGIAFKKPLVYFLDEGELYDEGYEIEATFDNSSNLAALDDIDMIYADAPDVANKTYLYDNICRLSDGTPTLNWNIDGFDSNFTLIEILLKLLASRNRRPLELLSGKIKGSVVRFNSIIKHAYNSNREFEVVEGTWNLYEETFDCTLQEIPAFSDQAISLSDGTMVTGTADLEVTAVTPDASTYDPAVVFNVTVRVTNNGDLSGSGVIQWKITDGDDLTITSGTEASGDIAGSGYVDVVIPVSAPYAAGTYCVKAKMSNDASWVASSAITVSTDITIVAIDSIPDGPVGAPVSITFDYTNAGSAGTYAVFGEIVKGELNCDERAMNVALGAGSGTAVFMGFEYPNADTGLTVKLAMSDGGAATESNEFDSVAVTINHIDTVADQEYNGAFSGITFEAVVAAAVTMIVYWHIRNSLHAVIASGNVSLNLSSGTSTYTVTGNIPALLRTDCDIQIGRTTGCLEATSNHFDIIL